MPNSLVPTQFPVSTLACSSEGKGRVEFASAIEVGLAWVDLIRQRFSFGRTENVGCIPEFGIISKSHNFVIGLRLEYLENGAYELFVKSFRCSFYQSKRVEWFFYPLSLIDNLISLR